MGPHSFKCGKKSPPRRISTGANWLQWGRTLSSAESPPFSAFGRSIGRFNGAALFQVRKVEVVLASPDAITQASMGPHSFKCGKLCSPENQAPRRRGASMGPHSFKCGKPNFLGNSTISPQKASMGPHSFKCGKVRLGRRLRRPAQFASMGPHSFKCGKASLVELVGKVTPEASMGPHSFKCGK